MWNLGSKTAVAMTAVLSLALWTSNSLLAATIEKGGSIDDIPPSGNPNFTFQDTYTQNGAYTNSMYSWYTNYTLVLPTDTGFNVYVENSGDFNFEQTEGEHYDGTNGHLSASAQLDHDGNVISGEYVLTGEIEELGIVESEMLTQGELSDFGSEDTVLGFATDNISCASQIQFCLVAESIYMFTNGAVPSLDEISGSAGYFGYSASLTTVPLPGSVVFLLSALGLLAQRATVRK